MWNVTQDDIEAMAIGAGILGTGGGGSPYIGRLRMQEILKQGYTVQIMPLEELADDARVCEVGWMGAPTVGVEKLPNGDESVHVVAALEEYIGHKIDAIACSEVGGANSIAPLEAGALTNKPVVDGDAMGRAFPEMQMSTLFINGVGCTPAAMVDEKGNTVIFGHLTDSRTFEKFGRDLCVQMGCVSLLALPVMSGADVKAHSVPRTLTLVKKVGDAVLHARTVKSPFVDAVLDVTGGKEIFAGKLIDVQRRTIAGFARGELVAEGLGSYRGDFLHIAFQNENLVAWRGNRDSRDEVVACVPDLICMLESDTGEPITTEQLRYGLRINILAIPCTDKFRTEKALKVVGPAAFGYPEVTYNPLPKRPGQGIE
ncbi:MAG: DUF917 family protein [Anaerolineaceae bacterium]|nr:DUF917 family protein [Anaerolineaceae bacterium]